MLPGYFETMRTSLVEGRTFSDADNDPRRNLVVVDRLLAGKAFPHESAIGKRILIRMRTPEPEWVEIIGVVEHQRVTSLANAGREQVYFANAFTGNFARKWAIRTRSDPSSFSNAVQSALRQLDPQLLVTDLRPMTVLVARAQAGTRFSLLLISVFAAIASVLVTVGLYGVLSTVVRQRTAEIGVRMALGASPTNILGLVVGHGLRLSAAGIVIGLATALVVTRAMAAMLVGVRATDPLTFAAIAAGFFAVAAVSSWLPAQRAAALDPTAALRE